MTDEKEQAKGPAKGIRVSTHTHALIKQHMHRMHADSMEEALATILGESALHIPMPPEVIERWEDEAKQSGFPLPQWVAQRVEGYLANRSYAGEVRKALNELLGLRKAMAAPAAAYDIHRGVMPPRAVHKFADPGVEIVSLEEAKRRGAPAEGEHTESLGPRVPKKPAAEHFMPCGDCKTPEACAGGNRQHRDCP